MEKALRRRPPLYVIDALSHLSVAIDRRLPKLQFEMLMGNVWSRAIAIRAIAALERRGWVVLQSGTIHITDTGHAAASGELGNLTQSKRKTFGRSLNRVAATRMPRGLF